MPVTYLDGRWAIGIHSHRFGNSVYLFRIQTGSEFTKEMFEQYLGDDFEPDRDDESVTLEWLNDDQVDAL